jgi:hypothetical protein
MHSSILGTTNCVSGFNSDIQKILSFNNENQNYSEFRIGDWKTYVLKNASGLDDDGLVSESDLPLKLTPRGSNLTEINAWIDRYFVTDRLRLVRVHSMGEGVLIPHRDFLEFDDRSDRWLRLHLPIKTNSTCLHSEEGEVFHMREGEVWLLDAARLHSATNDSSERRLNLCLDFELGDEPVTSVFASAASGLAIPSPKMIDREKMDKGFYEGLIGLSQCINDENFRDIVGLLSKVHFYREASLAQFFDWLLEVCLQSGSKNLIEKSSRFCSFLRAERSMNERFVL